MLISEAVRGEGAYLINHAGERFMASYAPQQMELAPRDITSRAIVTEVLAGRGIDGQSYVYLDLRHLGSEVIQQRLPFCWEEAHRHLGIDAVVEPIPVRPTIHYSMGGIPVTTDCQVRRNADELVEGFFAAGESACVSVHGANRLGSNALLECVVYGRRAGASIVEAIANRSLPPLNPSPYLEATDRDRDRWLNNPGTIRIDVLRRRFQDCMTDYCGVYRTAALIQTGLGQLTDLEAALSQIRLDDRGSIWNTELTEAWELRNLMQVGRVIMTGALHRQESRGAHARQDYPQRHDNQFLQHTLAVSPHLGEVAISYRPVTITHFPPQERRY